MTYVCLFFVSYVNKSMPTLTCFVKSRKEYIHHYNYKRKKPYMIREICDNFLKRKKEKKSTANKHVKED